MNVNCSAEPCPVILNATCVFYEGGNLIYTGINTNDSLQVALEKIDAKFHDAAIGYVFQNGIIQTANGQPVRLGGTLMQNTVIANSGFTFKITDSVESAKFITTGGLPTQFVKGDGSLDGTSYQPTGNYITALTGDGTANGPGSAVFTLNTVNTVPGTFGSATRVPIVTVNSKGLVTFVTTVPIPPAVAIWGGITGTITNQPDLIAYLSGNYYPLVGNPSGFLTAGSLAPYLTIASAAATYVPLSRTLTINGQTYDLSANRTWTVSGLPSQTGHAGEYLTTDGTTASWAILPPSGVSAVTASAPLSSTGGATPDISISQASGASDGYLSSADWTTFNSKEPAIAAGTTAQYWRGDKTWQTFPTIPTVTPSALTKTDDTNVTLTLGGTPATALLQPVSLTLGWTGTLADGRIASASTWNAKQDAISLTTTGTSGAATFIGNTLNIPQYQSALTNPITGTGTTNYLSKFTGTTTLGNSLIYDNGSFVGVGTNTPATNFDVVGSIKASTQVYVGNSYLQDEKVGGAATQFRVVTDIVNRPVYISPNNVDILSVNEWIGGGYRSVGISDDGTPLYAANYASVLLGLASTSRGFLLPKMTSTQRGAISSPETGLQVYSTTSNKISYYDGANWQELGSGSGTVTSVAALTLGTSGTDLSSSVANSTTTPVITLNVPDASATNRGALTAADWINFNSKQGALTLTTTGTSGAATLVANTLNIPQYGGVSEADAIAYAVAL